LSDVAVHSTKEGFKGGKKRRKQRPQGDMTMTDHNDGNNGKASGSDVGRVATVEHSNKRQERPPTYHFKRLLEESYPHHAYPVRHKLKDYDMMKSFMISRSLTRGTKLDEDSGESNTMSFSGEDAIMTIYGGRPHQGGVVCLP
jgi:hypothetical protein